MSFDWPIALLAMLAIPALVAAYVWRERRRTAFAARFATPALLPNIVDRRPGWRRHLPPAVMLAALTAMLLGVARPHASVSVPREEATILLALDVSASMTAKDVRPSRLAAARAAADRFVRKVPEKFRVGVVAVASRAVAVVPPTADRETVRAGLASLRPGEGTALGDAVVLSLELARRAGSRAGPRPPAAMLLISDGAQTTGRAAPAAAARRARLLRTPVYTVLVGTQNGTIERTLTGGFREVTRVPPDPRTLQAIAATSGGEFFTAPDDRRLTRVYERLASRLGKRTERREITDVFSAAAAILLLAGATTSTLWFRRAV